MCISNACITVVYRIRSAHIKWVYLALEISRSRLPMTVAVVMAVVAVVMAVVAVAMVVVAVTVVMMTNVTHFMHIYECICR